MKLALCLLLALAASAHARWVGAVVLEGPYAARRLTRRAALHPVSGSPRPPAACATPARCRPCRDVLQAPKCNGASKTLCSGVCTNLMLPANCECLAS